MDIDLQPGEAIVHEGRANLMRGPEGVGGRLWLTDRRLHFDSHALNVQRGALDIALPDVDRVETGWTKVFGLVPLAPNSLVVHLRDGASHSFVVSKRGQWVSAIDAQRA